MKCKLKKYTVYGFGSNLIFFESIFDFIGQTTDKAIEIREKNATRDLKDQSDHKEGITLKTEKMKFFKQK